MALVPLNPLVSFNCKSVRHHISRVYKCGDVCSKVRTQRQ